MPRVVDREERRRQITYAVWQLAAEAGVSVGLIQHPFAAKEALVRHGCRALVDAASTAFRERTGATEPAAAPQELLAHAVPRTGVQRVGVAVWYAYLTQSAADPEIAAILSEAKRGARAALRKLFATADGLATRVLIGQLSAPEALSVLEREPDVLLRG